MAERITIVIETGNSAFADSLSIEVSRILRSMARQYEQTGSANPPRDVNGNIVGTIDEVKLL